MLQTTLLSLSLSLLLSQTQVSEAEVFVDQSTFFARAGAAKGLKTGQEGLKTGQEVWVVDAETGKVSGSALVMELWEDWEAPTLSPWNVLWWNAWKAKQNSA